MSAGDKPMGGLEEVHLKAIRSFILRYGREPRWVVCAPGRVNLIGEHTDYNGGFVLPLAIDRWTVIAADYSLPGWKSEPRLPGAKGDNPPRRARMYSAALDDTVVLELDHLTSDDLPDWSRYVAGVFALCAERGMCPAGIDAVIESSIPLGAGLSSSAALEVACATLIEAICGCELPAREKAFLCQEAERSFAGVPCGIMDQYVVTNARADHLLLIDCECVEAQQVPFADPSIAILIIDSGITRKLSGGSYRERHAECRRATLALNVESLRNASLADLAGSKFPDEGEDAGSRPILRRRAHHVISEIERTRDASQAVERGDWKTVGRLMAASHASLRDDFEVSCEGVDLLVGLAESLGPDRGLFGARMTGAGFGGCIVCIVDVERAAQIARELSSSYEAQTGRSASTFMTRPVAGAAVLFSRDHEQRVGSDKDRGLTLCSAEVTDPDQEDPPTPAP